MSTHSLKHEVVLTSDNSSLKVHVTVTVQKVRKQTQLLFRMMTDVIFTSRVCVQS